MTRRNRTGSRSARQQQRHDRRSASSPLLQLPFRQLRNPMQPVTILAPEQIETLHQASMQILEEIGLEFMDDEALSIWKHAGAMVEPGSNRVRVDRDLIAEAVARAPATFTWRALIHPSYG